MFERYTEGARRALFFARYGSSHYGSRTIESEHLLLGLIRDAKGPVSQLFARSHVDPAALLAHIEPSRVRRENIPMTADIPFSPETVRILQHAGEEADRLL